MMKLLVVRGEFLHTIPRCDGGAVLRRGSVPVATVGHSVTATRGAVVGTTGQSQSKNLRSGGSVFQKFPLLAESH
jgi:hypothetical protein